MKLIVVTNNTFQIDLLRQVGFDPIQADNKADLSEIIDADPNRLVIARSLAKARSARQKYKQAIVLATDSIVMYRNKIISPPTFKMDALKVLEQFSGNSHVLITGWGLYNTTTHAKRQGNSQTKISFRKISPKTLLNYVNDYDVVKMIGCYDIINTPAVSFIDQVQGSLTNLTHYLPLESLFPTLVKQLSQ
jgi:septum formation protein